MKSKILTHKGTVPIDYKSGRRKPFRLRVTIGGKRIGKYFATRAEAETEWLNLAPLASRLSASNNSITEKSLLDEHEAAQYICLRALLAGVGLSMPDAVQLALKHEDSRLANAPSTGIPIIPPSKASFIEQINLIATAIQSISLRLTRIEEATTVRPRVLRNSSEAARYCGFSNTETFHVWANRIGFEIPKTKISKTQRFAFLINELDAAILRDPRVCRNRRSMPG